MTERWRPAAVRGFAWGALAGLALVALMYVAGVFLGLRPLPQALSGPILALMPGFVFGFLIDTLQHAGKVVEEFCLIVAMIVVLAPLCPPRPVPTTPVLSPHPATVLPPS